MRTSRSKCYSSSLIFFSFLIKLIHLYLSFFRIQIERPTIENDSDYEASSSLLHIEEPPTRQQLIQITGATIFYALAELTENLGIQPSFNALSHSVYRVDQKVMVKRNEKATINSEMYTTFAQPVKVDDVFSYPIKIKNVSFIVLAIDAQESLGTQRAGGAFPRAVGLSESLIKTAVSSITETVRKTLHTVANKTYSGSLSPFIQNGLGCKTSNDTAKSTELLVASISLLEQFISLVAERDCNFANVLTLSAVNLLIEEALKGFYIARDTTEHIKCASLMNGTVFYPQKPQICTAV